MRESEKWGELDSRRSPGGKEETTRSLSKAVIFEFTSCVIEFPCSSVCQ